MARYMKQEMYRKSLKRVLKLLTLEQCTNMYPQPVVVCTKKNIARKCVKSLFPPPCKISYAWNAELHAQRFPR